MVRTLQSNGAGSRYNESADGRSRHICQGKWNFRLSLMYFRLISIKIKVDVDELEDIAMTEGVQAMPTFAFFKNGEKLNQVNQIKNC